MRAMSDPRDTSHPPADPRPARARPGGSRAAPERPLRWELAGALALGVVLVAGGLYLWRRPHATLDSAAPPGTSAAAPTDAPIVSVTAPDAGSPSAVSISDPRVLGCHDRGPKKTPSDQCDHVASIEKALTSAVERSAACIELAGQSSARPASGRAVGPDGVGADGASGTIEYVADVSFLRHKVSVMLPRAGRSVRDRRALAACATAVRGAMDGLTLDGVAHEHARYKIAVTATYRRGSRAPVD